MVKVVSKAEAKWRIEQKILVEPAIRLNCLQIFADAIQEAAKYGVMRWAVTVEDDENKVRLHAGHFIVCTLCQLQSHFPKGSVWMTLDEKLLQKTPETQQVLDSSADWQWTPRSDKYYRYKDIEARTGYLYPAGDYNSFWKTIQSVHFASIRRAADARKMDPKTPGRHQSGVIEYLRETLGRELPDTHGNRKKSRPHQL